jgi:hypothetical protein
MPFLSKTADNLGLIFAGSTEGPFQFFVELFGEGFANQSFTNLSDSIVTGNPVVQNGAGGYTKLLMQMPPSNILQIRPNFYAGGNDNVTSTGNVDPGSFVSVSSGGDASGIALNDTWLAVAGGGGKGSYTLSASSVSGPGIFSNQFTYTPTGIGGNGLGGYNVSNPLASPSVGQDCNSTQFSSASTGTVSTYNANFDNNGASGGGAPGGTITPQDSGGGGGANIRIWYENNILDGYLTSFPAVKMTYVNSTDGAWEGSPKVVVSSPVTGLAVTFTTNTDITVRELGALLEPATDIAFDVELFGGGIGSDPNLVNATFFGPPSSDIIGPVANNSLLGGYTKLRVVAPISSSISPQPRLYSGGVGRRFDGSTAGRSGGNAAAFSIDGEWMGIAGGSGVIKYQENSNYSVNAGSTPIQRFGSLTITGLVQPTIPGRGGVNVTNPTASPQNGSDSSITYSSSSGGIFPNLNYSSSGSIGGGGGGGAPGGTNWSGTTPAQGGGGNIRVWAETAAAGIATSKGDLTSVPGVYMRLLDSSDGTSSGTSRVVIRSPVTGIAVTYTNDSTISLVTLRNLLYPGL